MKKARAAAPLERKGNDTHFEEVEAWLAALPPEIPADVARDYHGAGSRLRFLGLRVPTYASVHKADLAINALADAEACRAWEHVWKNSGTFETRSAALGWLLHRDRYERALEFWPVALGWAGDIDNWPHSDGLSKLIARCLELDPSTVFPVLEEWNQSSAPWKQRLSLTSLLYYAAAREKVLPYATLIPLVERHLESEHFYVQKAVGWTLRELHNVYPRQTFAFLAENIGRLKSYALSASTEKMPQDGKAKLKVLREKARLARNASGPHQKTGRRKRNAPPA